MSSVYKLLPHYTYDDYSHWEGRWELIDGIPYAMAPMPVPEHQSVATNLASELRIALKKSDCRCKVYQPLDYKLSNDTIFNPGLLVVCQPILKKYLDFPPSLMVEILSEGTAFKDRHIKYPRYEAEGIPYYLIVDVDKKVVEVYKLINGRYELQPVNTAKPYPFTFDNCHLELVFDNIWE